MYYRVCSNVCFMTNWQCVVPENIHTPPPRRVTDWNSEGYGSVRGKFFQGRGVQIELNSFYWIWNVIEWTLLYFPINSGNQTNTNTLPAEISITSSFFVMSFFVFAPMSDDADGTPKYHFCCMSSQTRCQRRGTAIPKQWSRWHFILWRSCFFQFQFHAFSSSCSQMRFILCVFNLRLSHIFIVIQHVVCLSEQFNSMPFVLKYMCQVAKISSSYS